MSYFQQDADLSACTNCGNHAGEFQEAPDGNLYEWVEGMDGLGNPIGFWKKAKKIAGATAKLASRYTPALTQLLPSQWRIPATAAVIGIKAIPIAKQVAAGHYGQATRQTARALWEAVPGEVRYPTEGTIPVIKHLVSGRHGHAGRAALKVSPHYIWPGPAAETRHIYESLRPLF